MDLPTLKERLQKKIWRRESNTCWPYLGYIDADGRGRIWITEKKSSITTHLAVYMTSGRGKKLREVPEGMVVLACPILKDCCNPNHIGLGTKDDIIDRALWKKGLRRRVQRDHRHDLPAETVRKIFLSLEPNPVLAEMYQVSPAHISNIRHGRRYTSVTDSLREEMREKNPDVRPYIDRRVSLKYLERNM